MQPQQLLLIPEKQAWPGENPKRNEIQPCQKYQRWTVRAADVGGQGGTSRAAQGSWKGQHSPGRPPRGHRGGARCVCAAGTGESSGHAEHSWGGPGAKLEWALANRSLSLLEPPARQCHIPALSRPTNPRWQTEQYLEKRDTAKFWLRLFCYINSIAEQPHYELLFLYISTNKIPMFKKLFGSK